MSYRKISRAILGFAFLFIRSVYQQADTSHYKKKKRYRPKEAPAKRHENASHATDEEHRTAEEYQWRIDGHMAKLTTLFAFVAVVLTYCTLQATQEQVSDGHLALGEARKQTNIAQENLIATTRAWIHLSIDPSSMSANWVPAGLDIQIPVIQDNQGNSPALAEAVQPFLFMSLEVGPNFKQIVEDTCRSWTPIESHVYFAKTSAEDQLPEDVTAEINYSRINTIIRKVKDNLGKNYPRDSSGVRFSIFAIVCADYKVIGDVVVHHTGRMFTVGKGAVAEGRLVSTGIAMGENIPKGGMVAEREYQGDYAD